MQVKVLVAMGDLIKGTTILTDDYGLVTMRRYMWNEAVWNLKAFWNEKVLRQKKILR